MSNNLKKKGFVMKKITFVLGLLLVSLAGMAQKNVVNVETAGTLQQVLEEQGLTQAEELTITGELNGDDIRVLRMMGGGYFKVDPFLHYAYDWGESGPTPEPTNCLKRLDLSNAKIVEGGGMYAEYGLVSVWSEVAHYTSDDVIGKDMFAYLGTLEEVKLPLTATHVGYRAFWNLQKISDLSIPEGVEGIEYAAFTECVNLKTLSLPSTLKTFDATALTNDESEPALCQLTVAAIEPPVVTSSFWNELASKCSLMVPEESVEAYRNHPQWGRFVNISSNKAPTAVNQVERADNAPSAWYSYDGRQLTSPVKGLNIVRMNDGSVKKVMVK
jgi:hypothetical protein